MPVSTAQMRVLKELAEHAGQFRRGYGKSAFILARLGLAKSKHVSDDGLRFATVFAISRAGIELLRALDDGQ